MLDSTARSDELARQVAEIVRDYTHDKARMQYDKRYPITPAAEYIEVLRAVHKHASALGELLNDDPFLYLINSSRPLRSFINGEQLNSEQLEQLRFGPFTRRPRISSLLPGVDDRPSRHPSEFARRHAALLKLLGQIARRANETANYIDADRKHKPRRQAAPETRLIRAALKLHDEFVNDGCYVPFVVSVAEQAGIKVFESTIRSERLRMKGRVAISR